MGFLSDLNPFNPEGTVGGFINPAYGAAKKNQAMVNKQMQDLQFNPVNVSSGGFGGVRSTEGGGYETYLNPVYESLARQYANQAGPQQYQQDPRLAQLGQGMFEAGTGTLSGLSAGQQDTINRMLGNLTNAPSMAGRQSTVDIQKQTMSQATPGMFSSQVTGPQTNIANLQKEQYANLKAMAEPEQARQRTAQENRLFAQGRLGSTGGAGEMEALSRAQGQQDLGLMNQAFGQAQQAAQTDLARYQLESGDELSRLQSQAGEDYRRQLAAGQFGTQAQQLALQQQGQMGQLDIGRYNAALAGQQQDMLGNQALWNMQEQQRMLASPERQMALQAGAAQGLMGIGQYGTQQQQAMDMQALNNLQASTGLRQMPQSLMPMSMQLGQQNYNADAARAQAMMQASAARNNAAMGNQLFMRDLGMNLGAAALTGGLSMPSFGGMFDFYSGGAANMTMPGSQQSNMLNAQWAGGGF